MRGPRSVVAAVVLIGLLAACSTGTSASSGARIPTQFQCPTDSRKVPAPGLPPVTVKIPELLVCQVALVPRGAQGWWLQLTQRATTGDLSGYLRAVRAPARLPLSCGYYAGQQVSSQAAPLLAFDSDGVLHRLRVPANCSGPIPAVKAAASRLRWLPARTSWLNQILPAGTQPGDCLGFLRQALGLYWPLESSLPPLPAKSRYFNTRAYFRDQVCALRDPTPTGPVAADLILARRVTGVAAARVAAALDAHPGTTGPDPIGRLAAPAGTMPTPGPCTTPTNHPYRLITGAGTLGYADLSLCLKAVAATLHPAPPGLLTIVEQLQTSPYE
jgi:hypothetical protein